VDRRDALVWQSELRKLFRDLKRCWGENNTDCQIEPVSRSVPIIKSFVYGYPTFAGIRGENKVSVTMDYFHHSSTSLMKKNDHQEVLCLSVQEDLCGFISFLHNKWYDNRIRELTDEWQTQTGDFGLDNEYFIQAKEEVDRKMVNLPNFQSLVKSLMPFSSLSVRDSGVHLNIPVKDKSQLTLHEVDCKWSVLIEIVKLAKQIGM